MQPRFQYLEQPDVDIGNHEQNPPTQVSGIVVRSTGSWHDVKTVETLIPCRIPGKGRLGEQTSTNPVAVGDHVTLRQDRDGTGMIEAVEPRFNKLSRRAAARRSDHDHYFTVQQAEVHH